MPHYQPCHSTIQRKLLFHRDFERYSGGHGKVWDYFSHTLGFPGWTPAVYLTPRSRSDQNPWRAHGVEVEPEWKPESADALLLGGMDWLAYPRDDPARPVINLVQHVRHGDPSDPRYKFLQRRAVRVCVSTPVAEAINATGEPNGPVLVIEAGIELPRQAAVPPPRRGVFIDALKQPALGRELADMLRRSGRPVMLNDTRIPRERYLQQLGEAEVAVVLPRPTEGFYLPGIEAMALGCATVVPDCIGNRAYLVPGQNALAPSLQVDALAHAVASLDDPELRARVVQRGLETASRFALAREREAFRNVLTDLDHLWTT